MTDTPTQGSGPGSLVAELKNRIDSTEGRRADLAMERDDLSHDRKLYTLRAAQGDETARERMSALSREIDDLGAMIESLDGELDRLRSKLDDAERAAGRTAALARVAELTCTASERRAEAVAAWQEMGRTLDAKSTEFVRSNSALLELIREARELVTEYGLSMDEVGEVDGRPDELRPRPSGMVHDRSDINVSRFTDLLYMASNREAVRFKNAEREASTSAE